MPPPFAIKSASLPASCSTCGDCTRVATHLKIAASYPNDPIHLSLCPPCYCQARAAFANGPEVSARAGG